MIFKIGTKVISNKLIIICCTSVVLLAFVLLMLIIYNKTKNPISSANSDNAQVKGINTDLVLTDNQLFETGVVATEIPVTPSTSVVINTLIPTNAPPATKKPVVKPPQATNTPVPPKATAVPVSCNSAFNSQLLTLINNYRGANGKAALALNSNLNNAACGHSTWMNNTGTFSHTGENGSTMGQRCADAGTSCSGEDLAWNSTPSAQNIFDQWKNSAPHNAVMLGNYNAIGIGLKGVYVTADFR